MQHSVDDDDELQIEVESVLLQEKLFFCVCGRTPRKGTTLLSFLRNDVISADARNKI